jgi:hypothetical protein
MRIIVANDPRCYREVIAAAFTGARPEFELITLESHELDEAIVRLKPDFVVCSRVSEILETRSAAWVLLYPDGESLVITNVGGNRTEADDLDFADLLLAVQNVEELGRTG